MKESMEKIRISIVEIGNIKTSLWIKLIAALLTVTGGIIAYFIIK